MSQGQDWADHAMTPLRGLATKDYNAIYTAVGALGQTAGPRLALAVAALLAEPVRVLEEQRPSVVAGPTEMVGGVLRQVDAVADELEAILGSRPRHDCAGWDCANCHERDNAIRDLIESRNTPAGQVAPFQWTCPRCGGQQPSTSPHCPCMYDPAPSSEERSDG